MRLRNSEKKFLLKFINCTVLGSFLFTAIPVRSYAACYPANNLRALAAKQDRRDITAMVAEFNFTTPEGIADIIEDLLTRKAPEWMAEDYRAGYLLIQDSPEEKVNKIKQAQDHLSLATADLVRRAKAERLLEILKNHPKTPLLSVLQFEGIAHKIVKSVSGNKDAYKEYKHKLDNPFQEIYPELRNEILSLDSWEEKLKAAIIYAGIGNLFDLTHPQALQKIAKDLSLEIDLSSGISKQDLLKLVKGVYKKIRDEGLAIEKDPDIFYGLLAKNPSGPVLYFLDNHGEIILDQIVIELLLEKGYQVGLVARAETARDDVTAEETLEIISDNIYLNKYLTGNKLQVLTDGSYFLGADLSGSEQHPDFQKSWQDAFMYIAKGAGNLQALLGQKLSMPGLNMRMMKGSQNAYDRLSELTGKKIF